MTNKNKQTNTNKINILRKNVVYYLPLKSNKIEYITYFIYRINEIVAGKTGFEPATINFEK